MHHHPARRWRRASIASLGAAAMLASLAACSSGSGGSDTSQGGSGSGSIQVWAHQGTDGEDAALVAAVKDFNSSQSKVKANLRILSAATYTTTITNTPVNKLPDVLEMDGPTLSSYVYNEKLAPLTSYVSKATIDNATAGSISEGTSAGKLYGLAMYDSALGLFGNKKMLDAGGIKYPTSVTDAWSADDFTADLKTLAAKASGGKSLDVHEDYGLGTEWGTFAFSPLLQSAGGNLILKDKASGVLDSADSVKAMTTFASWKRYVDSNSDGNAFTGGRVALGWGGHWMYPGYKKALGSNLVALPLPNFGDGSKTGAGSWTWGIGSGTKNGKAAGAFLDSLLKDQNVSRIVAANGAPPATKTAFAADKLYSSGGDLALWGTQLNAACPALDVTASCVAVLRPATAGYPVITTQFSSALTAIYGGADVKTTLTNAAKAIDQNYSDNGDYK